MGTAGVSPGIRGARLLAQRSTSSSRPSALPGALRLSGAGALIRTQIEITVRVPRWEFSKQKASESELAVH